MNAYDLQAYTLQAAQVFDGVLLSLAHLGEHMDDGGGMMSAAFARGLKAAMARRPDLTHDALAGHLRRVAEMVERAGTLALVEAAGSA